jgi:hypothetical protein
MNLASKVILGAFAMSFAIDGKEESPRCFIYRDDIGAFWGIHGY